MAPALAAPHVAPAFWPTRRHCRRLLIVQRGCEICQSLTQSTGALVTSAHRALYRVIAPDRLLVLCTEHAAEVEATRAQTYDDLRAHFLEPEPGQRSLIPRRTRYDLERRNENRRAMGRRSGD